MLVALAYRYSHVSHPVLREVQQKMADVATVAEENIVGVHVVKSFAQEERERTRFARFVGGGVPPDGQGEQAALDLRADDGLPAAARAGGGAARWRSHGRERVALAGRVHPVQRPRADARHAAADARHVDRPGAARDGVGRADLPGHRRARGHRQRRGCGELPDGRGLVRFERRDVRLRPGAAGAARDRPRARARSHRRAHRAHGLRQDVAGVARAALLRRDRGARDRGRCRRARRAARLAARA